MLGDYETRIPQNNFVWEFILITHHSQQISKIFKLTGFRI